MQEAIAQKNYSKWVVAKDDWLGVALSLLCLVHCVGMSVAMALMPVVGQEVNHSHAHLWFALGVVVIGALAFARGFCKHKRLDVVLCGLLGVGLLIVGLIVEEHSMISGIAITVLGSVILISSHLRNSRLGSNCNSCSSN